MTCSDDGLAHLGLDTQHQDDEVRVITKVNVVK